MQAPLNSAIPAQQREGNPLITAAQAQTHPSTHPSTDPHKTTRINVAELSYWQQVLPLTIKFFSRTGEVRQKPLKTPSFEGVAKNEGSILDSM